MNSLTKNERKLSIELSRRHGVDLYVFKDGGWIAHTCTFAKGERNIGTGSTAEEAAINLVS